VSGSHLVTACLKVSRSSRITPCCMEPGNAPLDVLTKMSLPGSTALSSYQACAWHGEAGASIGFELMGLSSGPTGDTARVVGLVILAQSGGGGSWMRLKVTDSEDWLGRSADLRIG
jgi:hypothetical protein